MRTYRVFGIVAGLSLAVTPLVWACGGMTGFGRRAFGPPPVPPPPATTTPPTSAPPTTAVSSPGVPGVPTPSTPPSAPPGAPTLPPPPPPPVFVLVDPAQLGAALGLETNSPDSEPEAAAYELQEGLVIS